MRVCVCEYIPLANNQTAGVFDGEVMGEFRGCHRHFSRPFRPGSPVDFDVGGGGGNYLVRTTRISERDPVNNNVNPSGDHDVPATRLPVLGLSNIIIIIL